MSDNISNWKTKRLESLVIPIPAFFTSERKDWHPEIKYDGNRVILDSIMESGIEGTLTNDKQAVTIDKIDISGEGSSALMYYVVAPALEQSTGLLEAVLIWEGGDIERLTVKDGVIKREEIEL